MILNSDVPFRVSVKLIFPIAVFVLFLINHSWAQGDTPALSARVLHLKHGINTSGWFAGVYEPEQYNSRHFTSWITSQDLKLVKSLGFDYVRLGVNPEPMFELNRADQIPAEYLGFLASAVNLILENQLAVIIVLQPESAFKSKLISDDNLVRQFADFWRALARHFSSSDPNLVFFEILNEPEIADSYRWAGIQARVAAAIRKGAPLHTIIAVGGYWSSNEGLLALEPLRDPNILYSFHFYQPYLFTHQGATWGAYSWHWTDNLRYPSDPKQAAEAAADIPDPIDRLNVVRYGYESWNRPRIDIEVAAVAEWARENQVKVVCDEFGVYRARANAADRAAWIRDVRSSLEEHSIGWAFWDYSGNFGLVEKQPNGEVKIDNPVLCALGLKSPCSTQ
jgi:aryl-phospho-beta-D-glucosidase BglC (GH1 family)